MHSYPFPQLLPLVLPICKGKELSFLPLKCTALLPCISLPTWWRNQACFHWNCNTMGKELSFLFTHKCTASYPSPQVLPPHGEGFMLSLLKCMGILDHMGSGEGVKLSSNSSHAWFLKIQSYPSPHGKGVNLASPKMQNYPSPQIHPRLSVYM